MAQIKAAFFDIDGTLPQAARRYICRTCTRWTAFRLTAM